METHYFGETNVQKFPTLIKSSTFFVDYATYLLQKDRGSFLTSNFTDVSSCLRSTFFAQVLLDLPQSADKKHEFMPDERQGVTIKAADNIILFMKQILQSPIRLSQDLMVIHRYNKIDIYRNAVDDDDGMGSVPEEFLTNSPYKCEVIITNVSPNTKTFSLLYQIPLGSMTLAKSKNM